METFDVVVIGSGPGGYVAAIRAAQLGLKTACIEKHTALGGTCLNVGCIPSKSLLHASELYAHIKKEGIDATPLSFVKMQERKRATVKSFNTGIQGLFKKNKVSLFVGSATLKSARAIEVRSKEGITTISAEHIILATGSEPTPLPFLPFDEKKVLSSTGALALETIPRTLVVIGAGVIGVELGSVYSRLGSSVVFIEFLDRVCPTLDGALSKGLYDALSKQGMIFHLSSKVTQAELKAEEIVIHAQTAEKAFTLSADCALVSIGRRPYTEGLGLENAGITLTERGFIPVSSACRTASPSIFAIGDIIDGPMLAHKASEEGVAVAELIAGSNPVIDYISIPNVVYTFPEAASVGLTEAEATSVGFTIKTGTFPFKANSRAKCTGEEEGFVKIIADSISDKILGIHILGAHASELISMGVVAIYQRLTALELAEMPQAHPTLAEAIKEAALDVHRRAIHK